MKYTPTVVIVFVLFCVGCSHKECNTIPYWKGDSVEAFKNKTMSSMLWIWPPPYDDNMECRFEKSQVFKRFDDEILSLFPLKILFCSQGKPYFTPHLFSCQSPDLMLFEARVFDDSRVPDGNVFLLPIGPTPSTGKPSSHFASV